MTLHEDADRLALQLEVNANAHQETPGTERRRAAAMIRDLLTKNDRLRERIKELEQAADLAFKDERFSP